MINHTFDSAPFMEFRRENNIIGSFELKDGKLSFKGDVDEGARIFIEHVIMCHENLIKYINSDISEHDVIMQSAMIIDPVAFSWTTGDTLAIHELSIRKQEAINKAIKISKL